MGDRKPLKNLEGWLLFAFGEAFDKKIRKCGGSGNPLPCPTGTTCHTVRSTTHGFTIHVVTFITLKLNFVCTWPCACTPSITVIRHRGTEEAISSVSSQRFTFDIGFQPPSPSRPKAASHSRTADGAAYASTCLIVSVSGGAFSTFPSVLPMVE